MPNLIKNGSLYSFLLQSAHETSQNIITQSKIALPKPLGFHTAEEVKAYDAGHNRCVYCVEGNTNTDSTTIPLTVCLLLPNIACLPRRERERKKSKERLA